MPRPHHFSRHGCVTVSASETASVTPLALWRIPLENKENVCKIHGFSQGDAKTVGEVHVG
jgi:hypothetical protein